MIHLGSLCILYHTVSLIVVICTQVRQMSRLYDDYLIQIVLELWDYWIKYFGLEIKYLIPRMFIR